MKTLPLTNARPFPGASRSPYQNELEETWHHLTGTMSLEVKGPRLGLRVIEGLLWVTQEGDPTDYLIGPDEAFVTARRGKLVIQSLTPKSRFVCAEPRA